LLGLGRVGHVGRQVHGALDPGVDRVWREGIRPGRHAQDILRHQRHGAEQKKGTGHSGGNKETPNGFGRGSGRKSFRRLRSPPILATGS